MDISCIGSWRTIIDNLMTQDNTSFKELMARVAGLSQSASINIFANREQVKFVYLFYIFFVCLLNTARLVRDTKLLDFGGRLRGDACV